MTTRHHAMFQSAVPLQWTLSPMMSGGSSPLHPHSSPTYITNCTEVLPLLGIDKVVSGVNMPSSMDSKRSWSPDDMYRSYSPPHLTNDDRIGSHKCSGEMHSRNQQKEMTPSKTPCILHGKGIKRHLDISSTPQNVSNNDYSYVDAGPSGNKRKHNPACTLLNNVSKSQLFGELHVIKQQLSANVDQLLHIPHPPDVLKGNDWDNLSIAIWKKFKEHEQSPQMYQRKMKLHGVVQSLLQSNFSRFGLYVVGSSMSGFGCDSSDMDMCLMLSHSEIDQRIEATKILKDVLRALRKRRKPRVLCASFQDVQLIPAMVPILKFTDTISGIEVDLNVNNAVGIRNTHLLKCYSKLDWRVAPLVLIIKLWARSHGINDAKNMTISSYSFTLMVIHFLQFGVSPPVLPCLHSMYPHKFFFNSEVSNLSLSEELPQYFSDNQQSIGELLLGFLHYFSNKFNFAEDAISVRTGTKVSKAFVQYQKSPKNSFSQWKFLCIEEPFDLTNTARSVYRDVVFHRILDVFRSSWRKLVGTKDFKSIFLETR